MQSVNRHAPMPLYQQLADLIGSEIEDGTYLPGDRLPGETDLAARHGVHRLTIRQALGSLSARGLIHTVHGRGSYVSHPPIRHTISGAGEASLTRQMRAHGRDVRQQLLGSCPDDVEEHQGTLQTAGPLRRFDLLRFVDDVPWTLTRLWVADERFPDLEARWDGHSSLYDAMERHHGVGMRRADRTIWSAPATPHDAEYLLVPVGAPLLLMAGLNVTESGEPVAVVEHRGRGDRVQFEVRFDGH